MRTLVETGVLVGRARRLSAGEAAGGAQVPATVQAVLAARIDRLAPEDKRLLQAAAVIGKDVPFALLAGHRRAARGRAAPGARRTSRRPSSCTRRACSRIWSTPSSTRSPTRWPTAACSRSGGARSTPGSWRRSRRSIPTGSPSTSSGSPTTPCEARCGRRPSATSGRRARRRGRARRIARRSHYLEQALAALEHLPESRDTLGAGHRRQIRSPCLPFPTGRVRAHAWPHGGGRAGRRALGDRYRLARALSLLCPALRLANEKRRSAEVGRRALAIAVEVGDQRLVEDTSFRLGQTYTSLGDHRGAEPFYRRNITPLPINLTPEAARALPLFASNARAWLATSLTPRSDGSTRSSHLERTLFGSLEALDDKFRLIIAHSHLGVLTYTGEPSPTASGTLSRRLPLGGRGISATPPGGAR